MAPAAQFYALGSDTIRGILCLIQNESPVLRSVCCSNTDSLTVILP